MTFPPGREIVIDDGGRIRGRAPPALQLAWIGPELPDAGDRGFPFARDLQGERGRVLLDIGDGSLVFSFVGLGENIAEPLHAVAPAGLELVEQAVDVADGIDPSTHDPLAASADAW